MNKIIPGILEKEWSEVEKKIEIAKQFSDTIHIDFLDGKFVQNTTFLDPKPFEKYKHLFLEAHLMTENPLQYLKPLSESGFKRFLGHIEKMPDQIEFVAQGQLLGEVGLAIDAKTKLEEIKVPYDDLDLILIMTINAGFSGQKLMPELLEKVKLIKEKQPFDAEGNPFKIEVDGGVDEESIIQAKEAGANIFVSTSCIFSSQNPQEQYKKLQSVIAIPSETREKQSP